jgi:tRNA/tmRNA/rRNA uracil-C5-methylase (TrmA/RlmC/RlmD family)
MRQHWPMRLSDFGLAAEFSSHRIHAGESRRQPNAGAASNVPAWLRCRGERIGDLFCGLGNFTLPIAKPGSSASMVFEGSKALVERARRKCGAQWFGRELRVWRCQPVRSVTADSFAAFGSFDKLLIDPPREGAIAVVSALPATGAPQRIVYVSCNPATLARDAAVLVHEKSYRLSAAGDRQHVPTYIASRIHSGV